jgi:hypothetical protein
MLIIPSSWGSQLGAYYAPSSIFLAPLSLRKRISARGVSCFQSFYFVIVLLTFFTLFMFASFYRKCKKISSFIVVIFAYLLLVLLE